MESIGAMMTLLAFQLAGEVIARALRLPLPGPVLGMLLLFAVFIMRGGVPAPLRAVGQTLLNHLSLLFVPAGVGVMTHIALIRAAWLPIAATLVLSTLATLAATALTLKLLLRARKDGAE